jgi:hypothetical protein
MVVTLRCPFTCTRWSFTVTKNVIYLAAEKNSADVLRMHAERNPEIRDILLQKAKFQETKHASVTDKDEYKKILTQVDSVLSQVEKELQSHTEGRGSDPFQIPPQCW